MPDSVSVASMRLLKICTIFVLFGVLICAESEEKSEVNTSIIKRIVNASVTVSISSSIVTLNITKDDGTSMVNTLRTKSESLPNTPAQLKDCGVNLVCVLVGNKSHTVIEANPRDNILRISRTANGSSSQIIDCYPFADDTQWFGGPQQRYQHWPIQHTYYEEEPYVPTHPINMAVTERYWLSSKGFYLYVSMEDPLFLDQNNHMDKHICLVSKNSPPYRIRQAVQLHYEVGVFPNPKLAHERVIRDYLGKPSDRPDERMIKHPVWSTWARYKANVSDQVVRRYVDEIISYGFNNSHVEIDDNWETCYGSATFDPLKFPNITATMNYLKSKGFRVTFWIHPFVNKGCEPHYSLALNNSYFVKNLQGEVHTAWWQGGDAATIDFTNERAVNWWIGRLKLIEKTYGINGFKFDAGEGSWLPQIPYLNGSLDLQPGISTYDYVKNIGKHFGNLTEVRVGWGSQDLPIFVRMIDKDSRWSWNNGLPTLITTLLQMNLNGYVHVLPDMIGGNGYLDNTLVGTVYPAKELFIRWLQANVFMPSLQYSFVPWDFDNETIAISRKFTDLHAEISTRILRLMDQSVATGAPLNPPIWWVDPTNSEAHKINDEFLLGEEILVAPVIKEDAVRRDVYLPSGRWRDGNTQDVIDGPVWLRNYKASLDTLPYFYKM